MHTVVHLALVALSVLPVAGQTYQEKIVAAVIMGEAWGEPDPGMAAVAEVIAKRARDQGRTPLRVVTIKGRGGYHAFSCLNGTTPDRLVRKYVKNPDFKKALQLAHVVCTSPHGLPGVTRGATHFTRTDEKPVWAMGKKAVAVIGQHSFYDLGAY